jgi:signal peptidase II
MNRNIHYYVFIVFFLILDQVSKILIDRYIHLYNSVKVIPGFFNLSHIRNKGAIFGFFSRSGSTIVFLLLTFASLAALCLVVYYFIKVPPGEKLMKFSLSLIMAGALGNLFDRIFRGYVIDFLDFHIKNHHFPFFNVADSCITVGAFLLIFVFFFKKESKCFLS